MTWPPSQPDRADINPEDQFFWDAIVARGETASHEDREKLAMFSDLAQGPERAVYTGDPAAPWDGVDRDSPYLDPTKHAVPYGQLLHSPELAWHVANIGALTRLCSQRDDSFSDSDREWASQVIYVETGISYFQRRHLGDAVSAGVRFEAIEALHEGREWDLTDDERLLTSFVRAVLNRTMTVEVWEAMEERLGTRGAVEYAILVCGHMLVSSLTRALNFYPNFTRQSVDTMLRGYKDGTHTVPDFKASQPDAWAESWGVRALLTGRDSADPNGALEAS